VSHESVGSAVLAASRRLEELREKGHIVTKLRIVINPGYLEAADAAGSWMKIADKFRDSFSENLDTIEKAYFIKPKRNDTIVLYGIIPTVKSMVQKYQLDKLVVFVNGVLETKNFGDLRFEEGLESALFT
jgi:hypothetical protein